MPQLEDLNEQFEEGKNLANISPDKSVKIFTAIVDNKDLEGDEIVTLKENSIYELANIFASQGNGNAIKNLLVNIRPFFNTISKAKTGKIIRTIIDNISAIDTKKSVSMQILICNDCINWCKKEKRKFLKQQVQTRLAEAYLKNGNFDKALKLITKLVRDVKKLDDKHLLVEVHLIESKIQHALKNIPKAKAALTAARAAANSIYIGPLLQAEIDLQAGCLSNEEKDYKTSYSYFYEAFEGFDGLKDKRAPQSLKYMLLSKIMNNQPSDVAPIITGKLAIKYSNRSIECMKEIANAYKERTLSAFEEIINKKYKKEIESDLIITNKIEELRDKLLEENLKRLLEPYEKVEISHIAKLINLNLKLVQKKLSQMILDNKFNGILDQGKGAIIVFDEEEEDKSYEYANETVDTLSQVVNKLFQKSKDLD